MSKRLGKKKTTKQVVLEYKFWKYFENLIDDKLESDKKKIEDEKLKIELEKKKEITNLIDTSMSKFNNSLSNLESMQIQMVSIMDKLVNNVVNEKTKSTQNNNPSTPINYDYINNLSDNSDVEELHKRIPKRKNNNNITCK